METALLIILATLPVVVIMLYINNRDAEKEPPALLFKLFFLGILSAFIAGLVSSIVCAAIDETLPVGSTSHLLLTYIIGVGLVEEMSKWFFSYKFGYQNKNCNEPFDPLIYCIFVSLGFAFIENIMYVLDQSTFSEALMVAGIRGIAAVPGHASDAAFMGFFLMQAWKCRQNNDRAGERRHTVMSIIAPMITHGLYDISCELAEISELIWIVAVIGVYVVMIYSVNKSAKNAKEWAQTYPQQSEIDPSLISTNGPKPAVVITGQLLPNAPGTPIDYRTSTAADTSQDKSSHYADHSSRSAANFCGECGAPANAGHNFCPYCGNKFS